MAVTVEGSGTQTATVTTEHTLDTITAAGVFILSVDCNGMLANDVLELRCYLTILAAGTERLVMYAMFVGVQPSWDKVKISIPIVADSTAGNLRWTLKQTFGTSRDYAWKVLAT